MRRLLEIFWAALREIFDESAYERFLAEHGLQSSPCAYEHFLRERRAFAERRARCC